MWKRKRWILILLISIFLTFLAFSCGPMNHSMIQPAMTFMKGPASRDGLKSNYESKNQLFILNFGLTPAGSFPKPERATIPEYEVEQSDAEVQDSSASPVNGLTVKAENKPLLHVGENQFYLRIVHSSDLSPSSRHAEVKVTYYRPAWKRRLPATVTRQPDGSFGVSLLLKRGGIWEISVQAVDGGLNDAYVFQAKI